MNEQNKRLINVDYELVRDLRRRGMWYEADCLINSYVECGKKNMEEGRKINVLLYEKERRMRYKHQKRCECCGKQDERTLNGKVRCNFCAEKFKKNR